MPLKVTRPGRPWAHRAGMGRAWTQQWGLTLLEVLAATSVLVTTCAAVTTVVVTAAQAAGHAERLSAADQALLAEAARLRALPFIAPGAAGGGAGARAAAAGAVGEVFPHADPSRDDASGRYVAAGDGAGSFTTWVTTDGVGLTRVARWARCDASGWRLIDAASLQGWDVATGVALPADALVVRLTASSASVGKGRAVTIVVSTDGDAQAVGARTPPTAAR